MISPWQASNAVCRSSPSMPCARALAEKLPPETEVLVTAEAKSIPLIYEMAKVMKMPRYVIARKSVKGYMRNPIITTVNSITNMGIEQ